MRSPVCAKGSPPPADPAKGEASPVGSVKGDASGPSPKGESGSAKGESGSAKGESGSAKGESPLRDNSVPHTSSIAHAESRRAFVRLRMASVHSCAS